MKNNIIIGISGATGIQYAVELLQQLRHLKITTQLITTKAAERTRAYETKLTAKTLHALADHYVPIHDVNHELINENTLSMIVAPCSMKTLAEIAFKSNDNLLTHSAAKILALQKPLILLTRETPLHSGHLRNMRQAQSRGATIYPPMIKTEATSMTEMITETVASVIRSLR